jgi:hypothetical protein
VEHLACVAATAALVVPPSAGILPDATCTTLNTQAVPVITATFEPIGRVMAGLFMGMGGQTTPAPGSVASAASTLWDLSS